MRNEDLICSVGDKLWVITKGYEVSEIEIIKIKIYGGVALYISDILTVEVGNDFNLAVYKMGLSVDIFGVKTTKENMKESLIELLEVRLEEVKND